VYQEEANAWLAEFPELGKQGQFFFSLNRTTLVRTKLRLRDRRSFEWSKCRLRVKLRNTQHEQMSSELPLKAETDRFSHVRNLTANFNALHGSEWVKRCKVKAPLAREVFETPQDQVSLFKIVVL
jgi:hypothetical protein